MKFIKFLALGITFGVILVKSEAVSWFRIFEMFHFHSFHMYGIIGTAVVLGMLVVQIIKRKGLKDIFGNPIIIPAKAKNYKSNLLGGILFGLGWALAGACPGPMFALLGYGLYAILIVLIGAIFGTFIYGVVKKYLPH